MNISFRKLADVKNVLKNMNRPADLTYYIGYMPTEKRWWIDWDGSEEGSMEEKALDFVYNETNPMWKFTDLEGIEPNASNTAQVNAIVDKITSAFRDKGYSIEVFEIDEKDPEDHGTRYYKLEVRKK